MGNLYVNYIIEKKKYVLKIVKCMVNLCLIYGEINILSKNDFGIYWLYFKN